MNSTPSPDRRPFRYFEIITGLFVAVVLISNVASTKILLLGPFTFDGGTLLFPVSYIFGDVLTEVYGFKASRRVIWTGFGSALLMSVVFIVVGALPAAEGWDYQEAYRHILLYTPRIVIASLIAYFAGEFANSVTLAKMKLLTKGRFLWSRTIGSTLVGEGIDTVIFCMIAFYGTLPSSLLWAVILSNYIFKCGFEIVATPLTYVVVGFLKRHEGVDVYDYKTKFTPFSLEV
jgi:uncharacterized integral membrane protein (TIGR00697 family)